MGAKVFPIALIFTIIACTSCQEQMAELFGSAKVGEKCERDRNCIENAFCRAQMTCLCDPYFSPTIDKSICIATAGLGCTDDSKCGSMANAACRQGVCACKDAFILDINNSSNCISKPSMIGDRCQRTDECQDAFGRSLCINGECRCISYHHFANETGKCVQSRLLYNSCKKDYECLGFDDDVLECKNGECVCKEGEACSKGSVNAILGISVTLLLLLQRLI